MSVGIFLVSFFKISPLERIFSLFCKRFQFYFYLFRGEKKKVLFVLVLNTSTLLLFIKLLLGMDNVSCTLRQCKHLVNSGKCISVYRRQQLLCTRCPEMWILFILLSDFGWLCTASIKDTNLLEDLRKHYSTGVF